MSAYQRFQFDRVEVPPFYTVKDGDNGHRLQPGQVVTQSSDHHTPGWITVGYVSKQTPLGQGTYLGFPRNELCPATVEEVQTALEQDHPHGAKFRPHCLEAADVSFHLAMAKACGNWLADSEYAKGTRPIINATSKQIEKMRDRAMRRHARILSQWDKIMTKQKAAILASMGATALAAAPAPAPGSGNGNGREKGAADADDA